MSWPPNSEDERRAYEEDGAWLHLWYQCETCGEEWEDQWSCEVDGECPVCGTIMTPCDSEDLNGPIQT